MYSSTLPLTMALDSGWVVNATAWPLYPQERDPVPIVQKAEWVPGPVRTAAKNLVITGIRSPDRPESIPTTLYRPAYGFSALWL